jgi:hypothetical protein
MFEEQQHLKFDVYDMDSNTRDLSQHDFLGSCTVTLGQVVSAPAVLDLVHPKYNKGACGSLIVSCEELSTCKDELQLQFLAKKLDKKGFYSFKQFQTSLSKLRQVFRSIWLILDKFRQILRISD